MISINVVFVVILVIQFIDITVILRHSKSIGENGSDVWDSEEKEQLHYDLQTYEIYLMLILLLLMVIFL